MFNMLKKPYYFDLDGVLADFNGEINAVERFEQEKDFFFNLKPIKKNLDEVKKLINNNNIVYIITASPNARCDNDKVHWLRKYLPEIQRKNIIILRNGQSKVKFMRSRHGILMDDYSKNCREWITKRGNTSCKITIEFDVQYYLKQL